MAALAVHSSAINRAAMERDIFGSPLGLDEMMFLEKGPPLRVVLYRSYRAPDLGGMLGWNMAPWRGAVRV